MGKVSAASIYCTALLLFIPAVYAQQRYHEAHVHGYGHLTIAADKTALQMNLRLPAQDVLGFEKITTQAQRSALKKALSELELETLWILPEKAHCVLAQATAYTSADDHGGYLHHNEHADHHDYHDDHSYNDHNHDHHNESGHMDISAIYAYQCQNPKALKTLKTTLFERFTGSQSIVVHSFTVNGQRTGKLTSENRGTEI